MAGKLETNYKRGGLRHWLRRKPRSAADDYVASNAGDIVDVSFANLQLADDIYEQVDTLLKANKRAEAARLLEIAKQIQTNNKRLLDAVGAVLIKSD